MTDSNQTETNFEMSENKNIFQKNLTTRNEESLIDIRKIMDSDTLKYTNTVSA